MRRVKLTRGYFALVDDCDYLRVIEHKWSAHIDPRGSYRAVYARNRRHGLLHAFILQTCKAIDHEDGNGLNCTRANLRPATQSQNCANRKNIKRKDTTSIYKGVSWKPIIKKWQASVKIKQRKIYLGVYTYETQAAFIYDLAAKRYFGEFAKTNFPDTFARSHGSKV